MKKHRLLLILTIITTSLFNMGCSDGDTILVPEEEPSYLKEAYVELENPIQATSSTITISVVPSANTSKYEIAIGSEADFPEFEAGTLAVQEIEGNATESHVFAELDAGTVYTIYARAYDAEGTAGPISSTLGSTHAAMPELKWTMKVHGSTTLMYDIESSPFFEIVEYTVVKDLADIEFFEKPMDMYDDPAGFANKQQVYNNPIAFVALMYDLEDNTDYYLLIRAKSRTGDDASNWTPTLVESIKTKKAADCASVGFKLDHADTFYTKIDFTPNSNTGKYGVLSYADGWLTEMLSDTGWSGDIISMMDAYIAIPDFSDRAAIYTGEASANYANILLDPGMTWEAYIISYDKAGKPNNVSRHVWDHDNYVAPGSVKPRVEITATDVTIEGATHNFTPNDATGGFFVETFFMFYINGEKDPTDEWSVADEVIKDDEWMVKYFKDNYMQYIYAGQYFHRYIPELWPSSWTETGVQSKYAGFEVRAVVVPVTRNGILLDPAGEVTYVDYFLPGA